MTYENPGDDWADKACRAARNESSKMTGEQLQGSADRAFARIKDNAEKPQRFKSIEEMLRADGLHKEADEHAKRIEEAQQ